MKFNPRLKADIMRYIEYVIIVEGKKDVYALRALGFNKIYAIHETGVPLRVKIEEIAKKLNKKDKVCILTDFDKKGKPLYFHVKPIFQEFVVKLDSTLRGLLLMGGLSHIEGLKSFIDQATNDNKVKRNWEVR